MRIHLKTLASGPQGSYGPGDCDVPEAMARALIAAGLATPLDRAAVAVETPAEIKKDAGEVIETAVPDFGTVERAVKSRKK